MIGEGLSGQLLAAIGGALIGVVVTLLLSRQILLRKINQQLKATREQFVALASHYLLTPISIIQGSLAQLQESESSMSIEQRHKQYDNIEKGQQRLWILAEEFILVNQIEQGMMTLKLDAVNVTDLVISSMEVVDIFAREKKVELSMEDKTQALREARVDQRRMRQALVALLDNAIKFSPEGKRVVSRVWSEANVFAIEVSDSGEGMSDEAVRLATQTFARGTSSYTFDHEGIGLGLYTAIAIVREHGGEIRINSQQGKGTNVQIRFPAS